MPTLFWAALAGSALLGSAIVVNMLFGRDLTRTREKIFGVQRLADNTRRLNDAEKVRERQATIIMPTESMENESRQAIRLGK
jgi:hypothetical protein